MSFSEEDGDAGGPYTCVADSIVFAKVKCRRRSGENRA